MKTATIPSVNSQVDSLNFLVADTYDDILKMRKDRKTYVSQFISFGWITTCDTFVMIEDLSDYVSLWPKVYALKDIRKLPKATRNIRVTQSQLALILTSHAMADGLCACA